MSQPIDYARADADVVREKFRRRLVTFSTCILVGLVVGFGWLTSFKGIWLIGDKNLKLPVSVLSLDGWIHCFGSMDKSTQRVTGQAPKRGFGSDIIGIRVFDYNVMSVYKWEIAIRYRTLFILAMIPWLITLIRLIRIWKQTRVFETDS